MPVSAPDATTCLLVARDTAETIIARKEEQWLAQETSEQAVALGMMNGDGVVWWTDWASPRCCADDDNGAASLLLCFDGGEDVNGDGCEEDDKSRAECCNNTTNGSS